MLSHAPSEVFPSLDRNAAGGLRVFEGGAYGSGEAWGGEVRISFSPMTFC
jgi:hypothetical protein